MEDFADSPCLVEGSGHSLSYADVAQAADCLFAPHVDLVPGLAFILATNSVETIVAYVGAVRAGFAVHLLDPANAAANALLIAGYQPDLIVGPGGAIERFDHAGVARPHPDLTLLLSTSGSTGSAKLVKLSSENIVSNTRAICEYLALGPADRGITSLKPFYSYGLSVINSHLEAGASLVVSDQNFERPSFWDELRRLGVTTFAGVPHHYERIARMGLDLGSFPELRLLTQAGGKLAPDLVRAMAEKGANEGFAFCVMYGQTEAAPRMSYLPPHLAAQHPASIGRAIPGGSLWLEDENGQVIDQPGVQAELVYAGPNVMCGYASARSDLAVLEPQRTLRTGDLAEVNAQGLFTIRGRASRFVKPFGLRLSLDDIEASLKSEAGDVAVVGDDRTIVVITTEPHGVGTSGDQLAVRYRLPASTFRVAQVAQIPRLASGKIDYAALRGQFLAEVPTQGFVGRFLDNFLGILSGKAAAPASALSAYRMVLGDRVTDEGSSFRTAGGDSLSMIQLQLLLEEYVSDLPEIWPEMPIAEIEKLRRTVNV